MSPWVPQDEPHPDGEDRFLGLGQPVLVTIPDATPGHFVASQGDALLLNAMDQHRSSANEWLELLQQEPTADHAAGEGLADAGDQLAGFGGEDVVSLPTREAAGGQGGSFTGYLHSHYR